jgi:hypothetical protein
MNRQTFLPRQLNSAFGGDWVDVATENLRTVAREHQGAPLTNAAADSGNYGNLALQPIR